MILDDLKNHGAGQFWQPAPDQPDFICARLESGPSDLHVHQEWQFAVADGLANLSVGAFGRYVLRSGDVSVAHPYDVHGEAGGPTWHILYVAPPVLARAWRALGKADDVPLPVFHGPVLHDPAAAEELRALLRASEDGRVAGPEFVIRAYEWLQHLLRRSTRASTTPLRGRRVRPSVERVREYLCDRPNQTVSLVEAVAVAGIASSHLVRSFSRDVGLPPKSYHAHVRLALARRLLAEGKSASWVAYECGFADQSHLSRRFKQCYGLTPGAFQAQYSKRRFPADASSLNAQGAGVDSHAA